MFGEVIRSLKVDNGDLSIFSFCIFQEDICFKIEKAFCPPKLVEGNPCLEYIKYIILPWFGKFEVVRKKENGGKR
jgi:tyrosyl-tRNA synthetase